MQNNNDKETIKKKISFFLEKQIPVHLKLKNKNFLNGTIIKIIDEDFILFQDRIFGEFHLLFEEIFDVVTLIPSGESKNE